MKKTMKILSSWCLILLSVSAFCQTDIPSIYKEMDSAYTAGNYQFIIDNQLSAIAELLPQNDSLLAETYFLIGDAHYLLGDLNNAVEYFNKEKEMRLLLGMADSESYSSSLFNLTYIYNELGNYNQALNAVQELVLLDEKHYGKSSEEYISSILTYAEILSKKEKYDEAKKLLAQTMRAVDKDHPKYSLLLSKEADIHSIIGHYSKAEKKFKEALVLIEDKLGAETQAYASTSANLASLYTNIGRYPQAEELLLHALDILKKSDDERAASDYINTMNNLALIHLALNQQEKALQELEQVLQHDKEIYGESHPYLAFTLSNIGLAYSYMGSYDKAEEALKKSLKISEKHMGKNSISYAVDANNLASMYRLSGQPAVSIPYYEEAANIFEEAQGKKDPDYISSIYNQGMAYFILNDDDAQKLLKTSLKKRKKIYSNNHPKYAESAEKLAYWYWSINKGNSAEKYFEDLFVNYYHQIDTYFPALSEEEKVNFFFNKLKLSFEAFDNYVINNYAENPDLLDKMLDNQLNTKALIMYATNKVRSSIINSGDSLLINQYDQWLGIKEKLSRLFSSQNLENEEAIDSLNTVAQALEKELGRKSSEFSKTYLTGKVSWKDVQAKLKDGEAVVEIIRFRDFNPSNGGEFTEDIHYVALLFNNKSEHPELVEIPDGLLLENRYINNYRNAIKFKIRDEYSYDKLWKPIGEKLQDIKKIYFSPDGVYNQVSINTLFNPKTNQYLLDEIEIRELTNSKDLLLPESEQVENRKAYLMGYPDYNMGIDKEEGQSLRGGGLRGGTTDQLTRGVTRGMRAGLLRYMRGEEGITMLPGTKEEVENISELYDGTGMMQETVMNDEATEQFIKSVNSPKTLHIATHGFFLPDIETDLRGETNKYIENPLLRSGLILAGAGDFLLTGQPIGSTLQDGILTAYEAMNLNLDETELVVLSACETGLGEIKNGEGVYGLQRAFLIAGADNIIMSMWSVDDDATQELMSIFYREWLESGNKQAAFRKAQQELKKKYKDPFYWGAFVMVGS